MLRTLPRAVALVLLAACLAVAPSSAQEEEAPDPWQVQLQLGLNGASGNSSFSILRVGVDAVRTETDDYELELAGVYRYGTNEEDVIADDARASLKLDWRPQATWSPFVFAEGARDEIRNLDLRVSGGAGVKWAFLKGERAQASLSLAALAEYENFDVEPGLGDPESRSLGRWSARFKGARTLGEGTEIENVSYYRPVMDEFGDYEVEITNTLSTSLMENLTLAVEHVYLHDEVPPPGAEKDDQKYSVLFRLAL